LSTRRVRLQRSWHMPPTSYIAESTIVRKKRSSILDPANNGTVQNWTDNRHGIVGYLDDVNVAKGYEQTLIISTLDFQRGGAIG
jgi:hypothetical protein